MSESYTTTGVDATKINWFAHAVGYHAMGFSIVTIKPGTKHAAVKWEERQQVRASREQLKRWCNKPIAGLAVIAGGVSGGAEGVSLFVRDWDLPEGYLRWKSAKPTLANSLPTVETARGFHVYFRSAGEPRIVKLADGEMRGNGYTLLPPSIHPSGHIYRWLIPPEKQIPIISADDAMCIVKMESHATDACRANGSIQRHSDANGVKQRKTNAIGHSPSAHALSDSLESAIRETIPQEFGTRNHQIFLFWRRLKAIPEYANASNDKLRPILKRWHSLALPHILTLDFDETWIDFLEAKSRVEFAAGENPLTLATQSAAEKVLPAEALRFENPQIQKLVGICKSLQLQNPDKPFYLSCRTVAGLLNCDAVTASRWLKLLTLEGILIVTEKGRQGIMKATRFKYAGGAE